MGEGYGPMIVSLRPLTPADLGRIKIAVPGTLTTAYLALKIFNPEIETEVVPFDQIIPEVLAGKYEAGLIIHEGQLTYSTNGLYKVIDLGVWWRETTALLPANHRHAEVFQGKDRYSGLAGFGKFPVGKRIQRGAPRCPSIKSIGRSENPGSANARRGCLSGDAPLDQSQPTLSCWNAARYCPLF